MSTMSLNEDPKLSFWEIGGYKPNIRRIRNGAKQLDDYTQMIKERLEIEQKYGKSLQNWHAKWASHVNTTVPDSIIKNLWLDLIEEGRELSQTHLSVKDRCQDEVVKTLGLFRKENYHFNTIRGMKEMREIDDEFEKAQRQWKKLIERADTAKKAYHLACRNEKSAYIQLMNLRGDASTTNESAEKARDRHQKCREAIDKTRKAYESSLGEIRQFNPVYTENMTFVFEKCQQLELKRLRFVTEMLSGFENAISDLINPLKLSQLHNTLQQKFKRISDEQLNDDLREWSKLHGVEATLSTPLFMEYTPELRKITDSATVKRSSDDATAGVVLTKQTITSNELPGTPTIVSSLQKEKVRHQNPQRNSVIESRSRVDHNSTISTKTHCQTKIYNYTPSLTQQIAINARTPKNTGILSFSQRKIQSESMSQKSDSGTSEIGTHSDENNCNQMHGTARVLYSYTPIEADEIPLTKDELVEVLSGPDELGWAFCRSNGKEGLIPASYVAII